MNKIDSRRVYEWRQFSPVSMVLTFWCIVAEFIFGTGAAATVTLVAECAGAMEADVQ
jgi:hypothetical protein